MSTATDFPSIPLPLPPASAVSLLAQARECLREAEHTTEPADRFAAAYLGAMRSAAAVLALRGRPHRGRAKPTSVWVLLPRLAPELAEWATYFASFSPARAAVLAGITRQVNPRSADDLVRQAGQFADLVESLMHPREDGL
ncbi:SAV_6107 family HEPN domain-containing protein [Saccharothrix sp.]|uniref:SAV_6107 family HEPN domain-containing protein n=1 Tax=Saccharothrix sp. TaxID=1873460 RepID=UPI0028115CAA|nr:SAV_6107 family HEPN domain-containing protein [Saccharothrix sp.]